MGDGLYSIKDLARELNVGESTVRFWRDRFSEFVPSVGKGKQRKYRSDALEALRFIQQETNRSKSAEQIREELSWQQPIEAEAQESQRSAAAAQQWRSEDQNPVPVQELMGQVSELVRGVLEEQNRRMESLEAENRELRERLTRLEEQSQQRIAAPQRSIATDQYREQITAYMKRLWENGESYRGIARRLNQENIPGFKGGEWDGKTVLRILKRASR